MVKDIELGSFFELATSNNIYVNSLNLHEIKIEILHDYTGDFELNGLMVNDLFKMKQLSDLKISKTLKVI